MADHHECPGTGLVLDEMDQDATLRCHAQQCSRCGDQVAAERALRDSFLGLGRPQPSPAFDLRLRTALAGERRRQLAARRALRMMAAYWTLSGLVCAGVVLHLPWASAPAGAWLPLVVLATVVALPLLAAPADLVELLGRTSATLRRLAADPPDGGPRGARWPETRAARE